MAQLRQVYKCEICGNVVEVFHAGMGQLSCCNTDMSLLTENTVDAAKEKHIPVVENADGKITVKVGSVTHPMEDKHYIEWIEIIADNQSFYQLLKPGDKPEAVFNVGVAKVYARAYCNLHGLWKS